MHTKSSLLGVALIIRSKEGPRFVFHYPPRLVSTECRELPRYGTELDPTTPDTSDDECRSDDDDFEDDISQIHHRFGPGKKDRHVSLWDGDEHFESEGVQIVPWEHLDAFRTKYLASILTPARSYHKKCFELTLDPLHFVTYPMHIREDGRWKKKKRPKKAKIRKQTTQGVDSDVPNGDAETKTLGEQSEPIENGAPEAEDNNDKIPEGGKDEFENGIDDGGMTMFNLVFILNPGRLEAAEEVANIFEHVAKDTNKALRYAQSYSNYVWKESDMILSMKEKAREKRRPMKSLWHKILDKSSLAATMRDVYVAISNDNIANVRFDSNPPVRLSVQIPKPYSLSVPPDNDEKAMPGALITTASYLVDSQDGEETGNLNKHCTLLLLDDEEKIMAEVRDDGGELAAPLLEYLKILKPTSSFLQTSQAHAISLSDIRILAQHLIYYRRAIAIPPLHARETYILSPNCDNHKLPTASAAWSIAFPLAPPLPTFLANLSSAPRPYKTFAPSKAHRPIYMSMLAWLLRNGWVTPLRTFAWVIVWPEIRYEVEYALDAERIQAAHRDANEEAKADDAATTAASSPSYSFTTTITATSPSSSLSAPQIGSPPTQPTPLTSEAIAEKARLSRLRAKAAADALAFAKRPAPQATVSPSTNTQPHIVALQPLVIKDPYRASHVDSLYLDAIGKRFTDEKTRNAWKRCMRYFDGTTALEGVALREGWKRKEAWGLMVGMEEFLLTVRHW